MEDLKSHLRLLHETEIHEIIEDAERQSSKIIEEAKERAEEIRSQKMKEILQKMQGKETSTLSLAKIEQRKKIARAKAQLLEDIFLESMKGLGKMDSENEQRRSASLERLVAEAVTKLDGTEFEILTNEGDKKCIKENIKKFEKKVSGMKKTPVRLSIANEMLKASGGVVVRTMDGKQIFNNMWEARLGKVKQEMAGQILELLFKGAEE
jgi:V/A-type H+-transporting ATPase subunit E